MFLRSLIWIGASATLLAMASCGPKVTKRACMGGATDNPLVAGAAMVRLDVYGAAAHCADGSTLAAGAGSPILSRTYAQGQAISLDVPPGPHALVLSTYSDSDGTQLLGVGCTEADLAAGSQICFDLTIEPGPDAGADDLAAPSACTVAPNSCPKGSYCDGTQCQPGCASDNDCTSASDDGGTGIFRCNPTTHACGPCCEPVHGTCAVNCTITCDPGYGDCNGTPADGCETNIDTSVAHCGACDRACSNANVATATCAGGVCTSTCQSGSGNCVHPAAPAADDGCETDTNTNVDNCGACNRACSGTNVATRSCSAGLCTSTCSSTSFGNCSQPAAPSADNGCETSLTNNPLHCGACTTACTVPANSTATCTSSTCGSTCNSGFDNCDGSAGNGCECATDPAAPACCATTMCQTKHNNGWGGFYYDCSPLGVKDTAPSNYTSTMGNEAANSYTAQAGTATGGWTCGNTTNGSSSICKTVGNGKTGSCTCWVYDATGTYINTIGHTTFGANGCLCPGNSDPSWN